MAYRFQTYTELGDFLKEVKPSLADRSSESLGLRFAERYGDKYKVRVDEEEDRATFAYDPEEGFNLLKTLGNLPSSAGAIAEDVATAVMNPLDTAEALGRGVAGAAEMALGTDYSPENKRVAEQLGQGLAASAGFDKVGDEYQFTGRGIQERPLDILGMLAGGASVGAKGAALGAKAVGRAATAAGAADATSRAGRIAGAAERIGAAAQAADPAIAIPRAAYGATKGAVGAVGRKATEPVRGLARRSIEKVDETLAKFPFAEKVRSARAEYASQVPEGLAKLRENYARAKGRAGEVIQRESQKTFGEKIDRPGVLRGLLEQTLGFTWNTGPRVVKEVIDIATEDADQTKIVLDAIRQGDVAEGSRRVTGDAIVSRQIIKEINEATKQYYDNQKEIHAKMREPLQLDRVAVPVVAFRQRLMEVLSNANIRPDAEGRLNFDVFFPKEGQNPIQGVVDAIFDPRIGNEGITLERLDDFKQLLYDQIERKDLTPIPESLLRTMHAVTRSYIGEVADNPKVMNAKIVDLRQADERQFRESNNLVGPAMTGLIPETMLKEITDEALGQFIPGGIQLGEYSLAMRQYVQFQDMMRRLSEDLRIATPESKMIAATDDAGRAIPAEGGGITLEEVLKQPGKEREMLRSLMNAFDDDAGLAFETIKDLADQTNRPEMVSRLLGASLRPTLAGGLAPRGEISQLSRTTASGFTHPLTMVVSLVEFFPALALFSPKYGSQALIRAFSPEGRAVAEGLKSRTREFYQSNINRASSAYRQAEAYAAQVLEKRPSAVKPSEVADVAEDTAEILSQAQALSPQQQSTLQTLLQGGTMTQRAQEQGEQAQQRNNILSALGRTQR